MFDADNTVTPQYSWVAVQWLWLTVSGQWLGPLPAGSAMGKRIKTMACTTNVKHLHTRRLLGLPQLAPVPQKNTGVKQ